MSFFQTKKLNRIVEKNNTQTYNQMFEMAQFDIPKFDYFLCRV